MLLVYGLLMHGLSMHSMLKGCRMVGRGYALGYDMYDLGSYPGAVEGVGKLHGEVYEIVDANLLKVLDEAEGVGEGIYVRKPTRAYFGEKHSEEAQLYLYNKPVGDFRKVGHGDWALHVGRGGAAYLLLEEGETTPAWAKPIKEIPVRHGVLYMLPWERLRGLGWRVKRVEDYEGWVYYAFKP